MKAKARHHPCLGKQAEAPEAIRARLAAFALVTRERAIQRAKVAQPHVDGLTLVGRQARARPRTATSSSDSPSHALTPFS